MLDRRKQNREVFQDTERLCKTNDTLAKAIMDSNENQYIIKENDVMEADTGHRFSNPVEIIVSKKRSLEAAGAYRGQKVCVHNFASATNPGGGVASGSSAQEESICRCSTLYFNLNDKNIVNAFYYRHRQMLSTGEMNALYNADCVFTPGVMVFKSDDALPKLLKAQDWYPIDIITCAAPNLRERPSNAMNPNSGTKAVKVTEKELKEIHINRMRRILDIAKKEKEDVVILGAFGCGAFQNSSRVVAEAMAAVLKEYQYDFKVIEFAIYCTARDTENYEVFKRRLG